MTLKQIEIKKYALDKAIESSERNESTENIISRATIFLKYLQDSLPEQQEDIDDKD